MGYPTVALVTGYHQFVTVQMLTIAASLGRGLTGGAEEDHNLIGSA